MPKSIEFRRLGRALARFDETPRPQAEPRIVVAMRTLDEHLGGALRGIPFALDPGRAFHAEHPKSSWAEVLGLDHATFLEEFEALGAPKEKERLGIFLVNSCKINSQPPCPYGRQKTETGGDGPSIKWYTFGERLPRELSVKSYYGKLVAKRIDMPVKLKRYLEDHVISTSPRKRKRSASSGIAAGAPASLLPVELRPEDLCGVVDATGSKLTREEVGAHLATMGWKFDDEGLSSDDDRAPAPAAAAAAAVPDARGSPGRARRA